MQDPRDFTTVDGIRVTTVARTLLDLAAVVNAQHLARAVDRAERLELFDLAAVNDVLSRAKSRRGAAALRRAIAAWRPQHTRSELEKKLQELLRVDAPELLLRDQPETSRPRFNAMVDGDERTHEVDAFWPSHGLIVELDSFAYHRTRADLERDGATTADLELAGYRVIRLTWSDLTVHKSRTIRRLRRLLL
jgi:hypothetical protein